MTYNLRKHGWETALNDTTDRDIDTIQQTWLCDGFKHEDFEELWAGFDHLDVDEKEHHEMFETAEDWFRRNHGDCC